MKQHSTSLRRLRRSPLVVLAFAILWTWVGVGFAADCTSLTVQTNQVDSVLFVDGFESGDVSRWSDPSPAFSAGEILDLDFVVEIDDPLNGDHALELKIYTPNGHLYQSLAVPITPELKKSGQFVRLPGYPRPTEVQVVEYGRPDNAKAQGATLRIPVAGTSIGTASLYGTWTVEPYLDWEPVSCGEEALFVIIE